MHVRESGAWRYRDAQAEPSAWSVVSTRLSEPEGARPRPDWGDVMSGIAVLVIVAGVTVGVLAVAVWAALAGHVWGAFVAGVVALSLTLTTGAWVLLLRDQYRDPPRYDFVPDV